MVGQKQSNEQLEPKTEFSRFHRMILGFLIADLILILFLLSGFVFASRIPAPRAGARLGVDYEVAAKPSPFEVARPAPARRTQVPLVRTTFTQPAGEATSPQQRVVYVSQ